MSATPSTMLKLQTTAPDFSLPDYNGNMVSLSGITGKKAYLVAFICNHCPYVKHIVSVFSKLAREWITRDISVIAISSNDFTAYPEDAPDKMKEFAEKHQFSFPYLIDESQGVAQAYRAACTPDLFLFDSDKKLVYRGQFDDSRPGNEKPVTGEDLLQAVNALLSGGSVSEKQIPSIGCNIKWKSGNEPDYF